MLLATGVGIGGWGLLKLSARVGSGAGVEVAGWFGKWAQLEMWASYGVGAVLELGLVLEEEVVL